MELTKKQLDDIHIHPVSVYTNPFLEVDISKEVVIEVPLEIEKEKEKEIEVEVIKDDFSNKKSKRK